MTRWLLREERPHRKLQVKEERDMANLKITLIKSLNNKVEKQVLTAYSLGLKKIGDVTEQPDNAQTQGKIKVISHLIKVDEA